MATGCNYVTDDGSCSSSRERRLISYPIVDILKSGSVVSYTIPFFSVITVELKHVGASVWDDQKEYARLFDVFMQNDYLCKCAVNSRNPGELCSPGVCITSPLQ